MNKLYCNKISKSFVINKDKLNVLSNITLEISESEKIAISGKSGAGKSTLLHIMAGLDNPTAGHISFNDKNFSKLSRNALSKIRLLNFGFVWSE